jgi:hypothetical protein
MRFQSGPISITRSVLTGDSKCSTSSIAVLASTWGGGGEEVGMEEHHCSGGSLSKLQNTRHT